MELKQFVIRSFIPAQDIPRLISLYRTVEASDQLGADVSEQAIRNQIEQPAQDAHQDRWIVEAPDDPQVLIGSALARLSASRDVVEANIVVHPTWRRNGIGSSLLSRVIEYSHKERLKMARIYADSRLPSSSFFLQKHGFVPKGAYTEMRLAEGLRLPPVIWPYGYSMKPYIEVQDPKLLTEAMNLSYIPLWGHSEVSQAEMASWLPNFNQHGLFLVFSEKGRVVGISRVELSAERSKKNQAPTGYIDAPGVVPQHRRLDLYRALLLTGIHWLQGQGQSVIEMESWGDKLEVLKMYRELGFKDLRQLVCYELVFGESGVYQDQVSP